jgi:hypothetical protein
MNYQYKIWGLKLTKSEPFLHHSNKEIIWDGVNKNILLDQENDLEIARYFAKAVKNSTLPKHWKIWIETTQSKDTEEIGYT